MLNPQVFYTVNGTRGHILQRPNHNVKKNELEGSRRQGHWKIQHKQILVEDKAFDEE